MRRLQKVYHLYRKQESIDCHSLSIAVSKVQDIETMIKETSKLVQTMIV
jgi:hypothetical protein